MPPYTQAPFHLLPNPPAPIEDTPLAAACCSHTRGSPGSSLAAVADRPCSCTCRCGRLTLLLVSAASDGQIMQGAAARRSVDFDGRGQSGDGRRGCRPGGACAGDGWMRLAGDPARRDGQAGRAATDSVLNGAETQGPPRSRLARTDLTFELVSRHFSMPIKQAARELNVGITVLKKRCRQLGIPRWPHRKVKSLQTLISNVQELGNHSAQEDGDLTRRVVESLHWTKKLIEERPEVMLDKMTKDLRQACFKESFIRKRLMGHGTC